MGSQKYFIIYFPANENSRDHYKLRTDKGGEYAEK